MKKALITRFGAIGDHIHVSHIARLLHEYGFDHVAFQYNAKGFYVHLNNPFIDEHIQFEPGLSPVDRYPVSFFTKRNETIIEEGNFDIHIDLQGSLEYGYIAMEDQPEYYRSTKFRRLKYGQLNYYDQTIKWIEEKNNLNLPYGNKGELHFTDLEVEATQAIFERDYKDKFVIVCNLSGTSKHKLFYNAEAIINTFLVNHPDAICITMGDKDCKERLEFSGERIINRAGLYPFRQSMLMTKFANLTIGSESGLMVAANLLGCPTVQLMTAASIKNHGGDMKNDHSLQSPAPCSPCHKGPYNYIGCPKFQYLGMDYPICVKFHADVVLGQMQKIYDNYRIKAKNRTAELSAV